VFGFRGLGDRVWIIRPEKLDPINSMPHFQSSNTPIRSAVQNNIASTQAFADRATLNSTPIGLGEEKTPCAKYGGVQSSSIPPSNVDYGGGMSTSNLELPLQSRMVF
jgi:hypothetical protein